MFFVRFGVVQEKTWFGLFWCFVFCFVLLWFEAKRKEMTKKETSQEEFNESQKCSEGLVGRSTDIKPEHQTKDGYVVLFLRMAVH